MFAVRILNIYRIYSNAFKNDQIQTVQISKMFVIGTIIRVNNQSGFDANKYAYK